jgi:hypothetical protein
MSDDNNNNNNNNNKHSLTVTIQEGVHKKILNVVGDVSFDDVYSAVLKTLDELNE